MAKFELSVFNPTTGEKILTHKRDFMPVNLYIKFQKYSERQSER